MHSTRSLYSGRQSLLPYVATQNVLKLAALWHVYPGELSHVFFIYLFIFVVPPGHIIQYFPVQRLYPEPCTRLYGIRIYLHSSALRALTAGWFRPTRPVTVVEKACFETF
jgi:hypothetical protein